MIYKISAAVAAAALLIAAGSSLAQDTTAAPPTPAAAGQSAGAKDELKNLVTKIQGKMQKGQKTESDLAAELKEFDVLLAKHKGEKTDDVAQILYMKAMLYIQVFENPDKGAELVKEMAKEFPDTKSGKNADIILDNLKRQAEAKKIQSGLAEGSKFPDFSETDTAGKPVSIANYKGKVVLIDFWATWCGPCRAELPNVLATYNKYHDKGFEIIGVSLDSDKGKLADFTKQQNMVWQQFFDGGGWTNKLAVKYGIMSIPATYLLDREGKIIAKGARGEELGTAVDKALAAK